MGFTAEEAVAKLGDRDPEVRQAALVVLANLSPEDLATHAGAIVQRLRDDDAGVRDAALDALRMFAPEDLATQANVIVQWLGDDDVGVRRAALDALAVTLKLARGYYREASVS